MEQLASHYEINDCLNKLIALVPQIRQSPNSLSELQFLQYIVDYISFLNLQLNNEYSQYNVNISSIRRYSRTPLSPINPECYNSLDICTRIENLINNP
ncbi:unnamed protein product [Didymodactylos carnosus]|uniref:BHLH domain-containing protein n=1 Tax=Didymodactylos carnosus TaxID=1234261 RepID=A0A813U9W2_9BILA|nr:unnamed protein product [Didymodactylos carnosus]CAF0825897.1 unnamed protein product [Didymodactylos carnosus]CAF3518453.1 unnamed protein product [Didymodactylos carnosus]CAF3612695.1 unnamed protein product [Didymodactylos carnosus]